MNKSAVADYVDIVVDVDIFNVARLNKIAREKHLDPSSMASFFISEGCTTGIRKNKSPFLFLAQKVVQPKN